MQKGEGCVVIIRNGGISNSKEKRNGVKVGWGRERGERERERKIERERN